MDTATKTGMDAAKTAFKPVAQKAAETTGDLIGNKIAEKITSLGKTKSKEKKDERQEIYISPEKRQLITDDLKWNIKKLQTYQVQPPMKCLDLLLKKGQKFMISRVMLKIDTN